MNRPKLKFSPPSYTEKEEKAVLECINNSWTGSGPKVKEFEKKFCEYKNSDYSAGFFSCTSALFLSLKVLGIKEGDEVITTSMTFCSTVNSIINCKVPVYDIDKLTKNISSKKSKNIPKDKSHIPVHFAGYP